MTSYLRREGRDREPLSREEKEHLRERVFGDPPQVACPDCGGLHWGACPRIKRLVLVGEGSGTGNRTEVEYWPSGGYDDSGTIYPVEVWSDDEDENH